MKPQQVTKVIIDVTYLKHDIQPSWLDFTEAVYKRTFAGMRRNLSFVAHYLLRFPRCSLLVVKTLVTRCEIRASCSLKSCSLQKFTRSRCKIHSLLVAKVARCRNSFATRCKTFLLLVAEVARCKKLLVARCEVPLLIVAKNNSLLVANNYSSLVKTITSQQVR